MRTQRAIFPETLNPSLSMVVERYGGSEFGPSAGTFRMDYINTGFEAWSESPWMAKLAQENGQGERGLARRVFAAPDASSRLRQDLANSAEGLSPTTYWSAGVSAIPERGPSLHPDTSRPAFLAIRREEAGSRLGRLVGADTAVIDKIHVRPHQEHQRLATALAFVALGDYAPWAKTRITVPALNVRTLRWAELNGYQEVGHEHRERDGELGVPLDVIHFEGKVRKVRAAMRRANPWLARGAFETLDEARDLHDLAANPLTFGH
jgi:hypothetical protein